MATPDIRAPFIAPTLDPQKLGHFLAVYSSGSFSAAATENGVSQQAVSKSVANLEKLLGVRLFDRNNLGAQPTRFADVLARRAQAIVAESRLASAELSAMRGSGRGFVRIGLGWSFLTRIGPQLIRNFKARHPDVTVSIATGESRTLYRQLLSGEVEWVASAPLDGLTMPGGLERRALFEEEDTLVMRKDHPLAKRDTLDLEALGHQTWYFSMQLEAQWRRICEIFLSRGLEPPTNYVDLDSILLVKSLMLSTDGVGVLPETIFEPGIERPLFTLLRETPFTVTRRAYLTVRKDAELQPLARRMLEQFDAAWRDNVPERLHLA